MVPPGRGGICWLCRLRWDEVLETPFEVGAAATGRAELLSLEFHVVGAAAADAVGKFCCAGVGWVSMGRRYEEGRFEV